MQEKKEMEVRKAGKMVEGRKERNEGGREGRREEGGERGGKEEGKNSKYVCSICMCVYVLMCMCLQLTFKGIT